MNNTIFVSDMIIVTELHHQLPHISYNKLKDIKTYIHIIKCSEKKLKFI